MGSDDSGRKGLLEDICLYFRVTPKSCTVNVMGPTFFLSSIVVDAVQGMAPNLLLVGGTGFMLGLLVSGARGARRHYDDIGQIIEQQGVGAVLRRCRYAITKAYVKEYARANNLMQEYENAIQLQKDWDDYFSNR